MSEHLSAMRVLLLGMLAVAACGSSDAAEARVRVGTDLVPAQDFVEVVTTLDGLEQRYAAQPADPFAVRIGEAPDPGQLVARFDDVSTRDFTRVEVRLLDASGQVVMRDSTNIRPDASTSATNFFLYLDSLCVDVSCPTDRPVCTAGSCVPIDQ